jgi:hypothetical protein
LLCRTQSSTAKNEQWRSERVLLGYAALRTRHWPEQQDIAIAIALEADFKRSASRNDEADL